MDRRSFLSSTVKTKVADGDPPRNRYANRETPKFKSGQSVKGLDPYTGPWELAQVRHLLNRTLIGCTQAQINTAKNMTMSAAVNMILTVPATAPAPPRYNYYNEGTDPDCVLGGTWVNAKSSPTFDNFRYASLKDWWLQQMIEQGISIQEKMTLFLHNMTAIRYTDTLLPQYAYQYNALLRKNAVGNYKTYIKDLTINEAMLVFLSGYKNQKSAPDENYARELQELFTVGKGPDSKYTEEDVKQAARVLTGFNIELVNYTYKFNATLHDTGNKQFSAFYGNKVITGKAGAAGEDELTELVNMIFDTNEVAKHVVRALYRWFVYYVIDDEVESTIIAPLANLFKSGGYELKPVLDKLLKSEHFYDSYNMGCVIKNPIEYVVGMVKNLNVSLPDSSDIGKQYYALRALNQFNYLLGQDPGDPPNVAGWEAYRLTPIYHEAWINSVTVSYRNQYFELLLAPNGFKYKTITLKVDYLNFTQTVPDAGDPNKLISNLSDKCFNSTLSATQLAGLKTILLSGQMQDHYWTDAWNNYVNNQGNASYKQIVDQRLYSFYRYFLSLAESQLI